mmetsp:Transcript_16431/g.42436  ORF Transcript_16431/g.42436 Transcript_16431/m.42436 type:complete len:519 (+) Transcript_16431:62-1618(+)|eukprot:CAMPEP_0195097084 /NCGR_PEP_ID=MMETSP0448-20130528/51929_1 /TAXON_ID=66468 /ORGANISM="Heterocapsa triquestra, Strain CCMP 448" /LENGTH=518 /DNA_ID=CAMNT_0040131551 /DNA_START=66 /DNA_END=1622 /DNA_ORIENTATION=-
MQTRLWGPFAQSLAALVLLTAPSPGVSELHRFLHNVRSSRISVDIGPTLSAYASPNPGSPATSAVRPSQPDVTGPGVSPASAAAEGPAPDQGANLQVNRRTLLRDMLQDSKPVSLTLHDRSREVVPLLAQTRSDIVHTSRASALSAFMNQRRFPDIVGGPSEDVFTRKGTSEESAAEGHNIGMSGLMADAPAWDWCMLLGTMLCLILVDCFVLQWFTERDGVTYRTHLGVLVFWVAVAMAYNMAVSFRMGHEAAYHWCSGYILEFILSMDNLFVFHLIFKTYATPRTMLHKALFIGIVGAAVFRMFFFAALASMLHMVHWIRFVFGALLIYSGIQAAREGDDDPDVTDTIVIRTLQRCLGDRLVGRYDVAGNRLMIWEGGKLCFTLLVPVICCLEFTDILFAVDSVSAKVAQIPNYYIAYSSSLIAMFALRGMFFLIQDLVDCFELLKYGLCLILVFIGLELMAADYVKLPASAVCAIILSVFIVCAAGSGAKQIITGAESVFETDPVKDKASRGTVH